MLDCLVEEVAIEIGEHVVVEQSAVAHGVDVSLLGRSEHDAEILALESLDDLRPLCGCGAGQADQRRRDVEVRRHGPALLAAGVARVSDDQRHVVLLSVGGRALGVELMGAVHVAVIGSEDDDRPVGET